MVAERLIVAALDAAKSYRSDFGGSNPLSFR